MTVESKSSPPGQPGLLAPSLEAEAPARLRVSGAWRARGLWLGVVAYLVALAGTWQLAADEPGRTWGWLMLILAGALAVGAWGARRWVPAFGPALAPHTSQAAPRRLITLDRGRVLRLAGMMGSGLLVLAADARYLASPNETFGLAGWLWLGAIALLLASTFRWPGANATGIMTRWHITGDDNKGIVGGHPQTPGRETPAPPMGNKGIIGGHPQTPGREAPAPPILRAETEAEGEKPPAWTAWEVAALAGIVILAFGLRLWDLTNYPYTIHADEVIEGRNALQEYLNGRGPSVFSTIWGGIEFPGLWFIGVAASLKVGGLTLVALRLPEALLSAPIVLPFYGLVRSVWGRAAAIGGTAILAFSASHVHYSRVTASNAATAFFWAACFFFLLRGLRLRRPVDWALAGLAAGISEYLYYGTRLLGFILVAFMGYLLVVHWRQARRHLGHFGLLALGYLVGFGPLLAHFLSHPGLYAGRGQGVITWNHIPTSWEDLQRMWATLWPLMAQNLLTFSTIRANDSVYYAPMLLPFEAALLALGVGLLVWRWRHPVAFLMLLSGLGVLFVGGTLVPIPSMIAHWAPAFAAYYAAVAAPIGAWAASNLVVPARLRMMMPAVLALGLAALGWLNVDFYFNRYKTPFDAATTYHEARTQESRFQAGLGTDYRVYTVGRSWLEYDPETNQYLISGQEGGRIDEPESQLPLPYSDGKGLAFFFAQGTEQYIGMVHRLYPGGTNREVWSQGRRVRYFFVYMLKPEQVRYAHGLHLDVRDAGGQSPQWSGQTPNLGTMPRGLSYPLKARWTGSVYLPETGSYRLLVTGTPALVHLDGELGAPSANQVRRQGWHPITIEVALDGPREVKLLLGKQGETLSEVQTSHLWPSAVR